MWSSVSVLFLFLRVLVSSIEVEALESFPLWNVGAKQFCVRSPFLLNLHRNLLVWFVKVFWKFVEVIVLLEWRPLFH